MLRVFVTGIGLVSALGTTLEESWQNLLWGKSGIKLHQLFPELAPVPLGLIHHQPLSLNILTPQVVDQALKDAKLSPPLPDCAVVIGSSRSYQASWEKLAQQMNDTPLWSNLEHWLDSLPVMNAITVARQISCLGTVLAPMAACSTGIWAIAQAVMLIQSGQCHQAIAGAIESPITPLTICGFQQMGALAKTGAYPFDINREGLVLGEGGAVFVLESQESIKQRQLTPENIYGEILGFGLTADAFHGSKPEPQAKSGMLAIKQCLKRSNLTEVDIDYIHAHGTATKINDQIEGKIIQELFPPQVAISSTKGATGHTLGASGSLGVAFSLMAIKNQILPPNVGLKHREMNLNLVTAAKKSRVEHVLCCSFGFGGQNAVITLGRWN
ncbi:beta-ketoacyl-ACP synthase [Cylindrospermopsis raciborskii DSH]|uniref:beta-ketoacyl-ACP synthase n=1 Tax=Cylindrospermopsis raciborskii TaxID=77022 RepID=UPI002EDB2FEC